MKIGSGSNQKTRIRPDPDPNPGERCITIILCLINIHTFYVYVCEKIPVHRILSVGSEANIKGLNITGTSAAGAAVIAKANKVIST